MIGGAPKTLLDSNPNQTHPHGAASARYRTQIARASRMPSPCTLGLELSGGWMQPYLKAPVVGYASMLKEEGLRHDLLKPLLEMGCQTLGNGSAL